MKKLANKTKITAYDINFNYPYPVLKFKINGENTRENGKITHVKVDSISLIKP